LRFKSICIGLCMGHGYVHGFIFRFSVESVTSFSVYINTTVFILQ